MRKGKKVKLMKKKIIISRITIVLMLVALIFTSAPLASDTATSYAASKKVAKKITLSAHAKGQSSVHLSWNKIKKPQKGYAVFRDGKCIVRLSKKRTSFSDKGLAPGSSHKYQIKVWKKKGKKAKFKYSKASNSVSVMTVKKPTPVNAPANQPETTNNDYSGPSILEGTSTNELCRSEWLALYDDGHVRILKDNVIYQENSEELVLFEKGRNGSVHYGKKELASYVRGYELLNEKGYYYRVSFLSQPHAKNTCLQYTETNDPNCGENFFMYYDSDGNDITDFTRPDPEYAYSEEDLGELLDHGVDKPIRFRDAGEVKIVIYLDWMQKELNAEGYLLYASPAWSDVYPYGSLLMHRPWYYDAGKITVLDGRGDE